MLPLHMDAENCMMELETTLKSLPKDMPTIEVLSTQVEDACNTNTSKPFRRDLLTTALTKLIGLLTEQEVYLSKQPLLTTKLLLRLLCNDAVNFNSSSVRKSIQQATAHLPKVTFPENTVFKSEIIQAMASYINKFRSVKCVSNAQYLAALVLKLLQPELSSPGFIKSATREEVLVLTYIATHKESSRTVSELYSEIDIGHVDSLDLLIDLVQYRRNPFKDLCGALSSYEKSNSRFTAFVSAAVEFLKQHASLEQLREASDWLLKTFKEDLIDTDPTLYDVVVNVLLGLFSSKNNGRVVDPLRKAAPEFASMLHRSRSFAAGLHTNAKDEYQLFHHCCDEEAVIEGCKSPCWCTGLNNILKLQSGEVQVKAADYVVYIVTETKPLNGSNVENSLAPPTSPFVEKTLAYKAEIETETGVSKPSLKERLLMASGSDCHTQKGGCVLRYEDAQVVRLESNAVTALPGSKAVELEFEGEASTWLLFTSTREQAEALLRVYHRNNTTLQYLHAISHLVDSHIELPNILCCGVTRLLCHLSLMEHSPVKTALDMLESGVEVELGKKLKMPRVRGINRNSQRFVCMSYVSTLAKSSLADYVQTHCNRELSLLVFYVRKCRDCGELLKVLSKNEEPLSSSEFNMALLCAAQSNLTTLRQNWEGFCHRIKLNLNESRLVSWAGFLSYHAASTAMPTTSILDLLESAEDKLTKLLLLDAAALSSFRKQSFDSPEYLSKLKALATRDSESALRVACLIPPGDIPEAVYEGLRPDSKDQLEVRMLSQLGTKVYTSAVGQGRLWATAAWMKHFPVGDSEATETILYHCGNDPGLTPIGIHHYASLPHHNTTLENLICEHLAGDPEVCLFPLLELWMSTGNRGRLRNLITTHALVIIDRLSTEVKKSTLSQLEVLRMLDSFLPVAVTQSSDSAVAVMRLKEDISGKNLTQLALNNHTLSEQNITDLLAHLGCFPDIKDLDFGRSRIGDEGAIAVAEYVAQADIKQMTLTLDSTGIGTAGVFALTAAMRQRPSCLEALSLGSNDLTDQAAGALAEALLWNTQLKSLCLYNCGLSSKAVLSITKALRFNSTVITIDLDNNCVAPKQLQAIRIKAQLNEDGEVMAPHLALASLKKSSTDSIVNWECLYRNKPLQTMNLLSGGELDFSPSNKFVHPPALTA